MRVNVAGGTNAGWRRLLEPRGDWRCENGHRNRGRHLRCMEHGCNLKRPKEAR